MNASYKDNVCVVTHCKNNSIGAFMAEFDTPGILVVENGKSQCDILMSTQDLLELPTSFYDFDIFIIDSAFSPFFGKTVRFSDEYETFVLNPKTMQENVLPYLASKYRGGDENCEARIQYCFEWMKLYPKLQSSESRCFNAFK